MEKSITSLIGWCFLLDPHLIKGESPKKHDLTSLFRPHLTHFDICVKISCLVYQMPPKWPILAAFTNLSLCKCFDRTYNIQRVENISFYKCTILHIGLKNSCFTHFYTYLAVKCPKSVPKSITITPSFQDGFCWCH